MNNRQRHFFSYQIKALQLGAGSISEDGSTSMGTDGTGLLLEKVTVAGPLAYTVVAVPEPSTFVATFIASLSLLTTRQLWPLHF